MSRASRENELIPRGGCEAYCGQPPADLLICTRLEEACPGKGIAPSSKTRLCYDRISAARKSRDLTMHNQNRPVANSGTGTQGIPMLGRSAAILIMVAGAVSFAAALVFFDNSILCFAGSTLLTLAGLGMIIVRRRNGGGQSEPAGKNSPTATPRARHKPELTGQGRIPPGLRKAQRRQPPVQRPLAEGAIKDSQKDRNESALAGEESTAVRPGSLIERAIHALQQQGARVEVQSQQGTRGILDIYIGDSQIYTMLVLGASIPAGPADVRSLQVLIDHSGSSRGYLVAAGEITSLAYQAAASRPEIRLVAADQIETLVL